MNHSASCRACCTRLLDFGVSFGSACILRGINLHMHCGELTAIIGPNGAGKTTLLRAMIGEIPHCGELQFIPSDKSPNRALRIGYVPQKLDIDLRSPASVLDLFSGALSRRPLWLGYPKYVLRQAAASLDAVDGLGLLRARVGNLSGGELQRVLLALALTPVPDILLLDEPVAAVDQAGSELFYRNISRLREKYDLSILLISHDLAAAARVADRMILLKNEILCDGTPGEVLSSPTVKKLFGFHFHPEDFSPVPPHPHHHIQTNKGNSL